MPLAPAVATQLTDHSAHPYGLLVGGVDYIVGRGGNARAVPIDSVTIDQQGSGGVSSMSFVIEDPSGTLTIPDGTRVAFWNFGAGDCYFAGFVDHVGYAPWAGPGRTLEVTCTGLEAWLDWAVIGSLLIDFTLAGVGLNYSNEIGQLAAQVASQYAPELFAASNAGTGGPPAAGSATFPIGTNLIDGISQLLALPSGAIGPPWGFPAYSKQFTNTPLRSFIETTWTDAIAQRSTVPDQVPFPLFLTVDSLGRLRMFSDNVAASIAPDDYATLVVSDTVGGAFVASNLEHSVEYGDAIHEVYVAGGAAAATGYFGDGSGVVSGKVGTTSTPGTGSNAAVQAAAAFFGRTPAAVYRGSFDLIDIVPTAHVWPGSLLTLTDAASGATGSYRIASIKRTFNGDTENLSVTYGRLAPSLVQLVRRLTRSVLN